MSFFGNMLGELGPNPNKLFIKSSPSVAKGANSKLDLVLRLQSLCGCCPITSIDIGTTQKYYFFKWTTLPAVLSVITALYFSFINIIFFTHNSFKKLFLFGEGSRQTFKKFEDMLLAEAASRGKGTSTALLSLYFVASSVGIYEIVIIILNWQSSLKLVEFLNNWIFIEKQFSLTFKNQGFYQMDRWESGRRFGRFTWFDIGLCSYFLFVGLLLPCISMLLFDETNPITDIWLVVSFCIYFSMAEALEDLKNVLIYVSCSDAFRRTRSYIRQAINRGKLNEANIQAWRQLVMEIQGQCGLASKCLMPMQLAFLFNILVSGTALVFASLNAFGGRQIGIVISTMLGSLFALWMGRLYFKVVMAEKIAKDAASIANDLVQVDSAGCSESTIDQIRLTLDALVQNPSVINFGNYVVLNKRLFLGVISQVIGYLIVLMQFFQFSIPSS